VVQARVYINTEDAIDSVLSPLSRNFDDWLTFFSPREPLCMLFDTESTRRNRVLRYRSFVTRFRKCTRNSKYEAGLSQKSLMIRVTYYIHRTIPIDIADGNFRVLINSVNETNPEAPLRQFRSTRSFSYAVIVKVANVFLHECMRKEYISQTSSRIPNTHDITRISFCYALRMYWLNSLSIKRCKYIKNTNF